MPTKHRRVGVVLDHELNTAMDATSGQLTATSEAARLRELALIGAAALQAQDQATAAFAEADRFLDALGATRAHGDLVHASAEILRRNARLPLRNEHGETPSESLMWIRGHDRDY